MLLVHDVVSRHTFLEVKYPPSVIRVLLLIGLVAWGSRVFYW